MENKSSLTRNVESNPIATPSPSGTSSQPPPGPAETPPIETTKTTSGPAVGQPTDTAEDSVLVHLQECSDCPNQKCDFKDLKVLRAFRLPGVITRSYLVASRAKVISSPCRNSSNQLRWFNRGRSGRIAGIRDHHGYMERRHNHHWYLRYPRYHPVGVIFRYLQLDA